MPPLPEAARITLPVREKLQAKHSARHAIQASGECNHSTAIRCHRNEGIILLVIGPARGVAVIIWSWNGSSAATGSECDSEACIVVNGVAKNGPSGVIASEAGDADAVEAVKGNDVPFP